MQQIGTPITSITQGLSMISIFGTVATGFAYKAYKEHGVYDGLIAAGCLMITGLATYNTISFMGSDNIYHNDDIYNIGG